MSKEKWQRRKIKIKNYSNKKIHKSCTGEQTYETEQEVALVYQECPGSIDNTHNSF